MVVDIDYGVGVVKKRPNTHPLSTEWLDILSVNPISMLDYERNEFARRKRELLRLMTVKDMKIWANEVF